MIPLIFLANNSYDNSKPFSDFYEIETFTQYIKLLFKKTKYSEFSDEPFVFPLEVFHSKYNSLLIDGDVMTYLVIYPITVKTFRRAIKEVDNIIDELYTSTNETRFFNVMYDFYDSHHLFAWNEGKWKRMIMYDYGLPEPELKNYFKKCITLSESLLKNDTRKYISIYDRFLKDKKEDRRELRKFSRDLTLYFNNRVYFFIYIFYDFSSSTSRKQSLLPVFPCILRDIIF